MIVGFIDPLSITSLVVSPREPASLPIFGFILYHLCFTHYQLLTAIPSSSPVYRRTSPHFSLSISTNPKKGRKKEKSFVFSGYKCSDGFGILI